MHINNGRLMECSPAEQERLAKGNIEDWNLIRQIGVQVFLCNDKITTFNIPKGVVLICSGAYWNCENMKEVSLPNTLKKIGKYVFADCKSLKNLFIPHSVESIGEYSLCFNTKDENGAKDVVIEVEYLPGKSVKIDGDYFFGYQVDKLGNNFKHLKRHLIEADAKGEKINPKKLPSPSSLQDKYEGPEMA